MNYDSLLLESVTDAKELIRISREISNNPQFFSTELSDYFLNNVNDDSVSFNRIKSILNQNSTPINKIDLSLLEKCYNFSQNKILPKFKMRNFLTEDGGFPMSDFVDPNILQNDSPFIELRRPQSNNNNVSRLQSFPTLDVYRSQYFSMIEDSLKDFIFLSDTKKQEIKNSFLNYLYSQRIIPTDPTANLSFAFKEFINRNKLHSFVFQIQKGKKFEFKTKLWKILLGLLLILLTIVLFIYIKNKIKFKEMYTLKDLVKDIWQKIKTISIKVYNATVNALYKIIGTILALSIVFILFYFLSKVMKINTESFPVPIQILFQKAKEKLNV